MTPLPRPFAGEHLSALALSAAADGELGLLDGEARAHLAQCRSCQDAAARSALEGLALAEIPRRAPARPPLRAPLGLAAFAALVGVGLRAAAGLARGDAAALSQVARRVGSAALAPHGATLPLAAALLALVVALTVIRARAGAEGTVS